MYRWFLGFIFALLFLLTVPGQVLAQDVSPEEPEKCSSPYIVRYGDSLRKIARLCGFRVGEIIRANPQFANPDHILVGQEVFLPGAEPPPAAQSENEATVPSGDEESSTDDALPASDDAEAADSGISETEEEVIESPAAETDGDEEVEPVETYEVQRGDTLGKIAKQYGLTIAQMMYFNRDLSNPNRIYPGQIIKIPPANLVVDEDTWRQFRVNDAVNQVRNDPSAYPASSGERWILVDLPSQTVHAFEGQQLIRSFLVSTGRAATPTVTGQYRIWLKLRYDDMAGPGYYLRDVPYVMYFYKGYGLHGTYWHNNFGTPMSHGCVNLATEDSAWLFEFASEGTVVQVQ